MKVDKLEAHDRLKFFGKQDFDIGACCQNLIDQRPFGDHPFYIFAHARTIGLDDKFRLYMSGKYKTLADVPEKEIIWQPRLTKPKAQTNSMLFKAYPGTDVIRIIWIIPAREMWEQYEKGKMTENETICQSIYAFQNAKDKLEEKESDDLPDPVIDKIYNEISMHAKGKKPFQPIL